MKKIFLILSLVAMSIQTSYAYYYANESSSVDALKSQGFSESALILTDKVNKLNSGLYGKYQQIYQKEQSESKLSKAYQKLKLYFDPIQDDGDFFEHQIDFTNTWNRDNVPYAQAVKRSQTAENL